MLKHIQILYKIIIGTFLMALAVNFVYEPLTMITGGVSGISIVIKQLSQLFLKKEIPVWLSNMAINIPIFVWGYYVKGKKFLGYTFIANMFFSFFLFILPVKMISQNDYFVAALLGSVLTGCGLGLVFSCGYSTGGTDLLSSIIHSYLRHYSVANILFVIDAVVISAGALLFGIKIASYAVFAVFLSSQIMDSILSGRKSAKQIIVISDSYQKIGEEIMKKLNRGITCLSGIGMYSMEEKNVLLCVVGKREIVSLLKIIRQNDPNAFVIVQNAREVLGEGFEKNE